jgi:hypothetical protein
VKVPVAGTVCLDAWYATGLAGSQIGTYTCVAGAVDETWTLTSAGELKGQNGLCLTAGAGASPAITLQLCSGAATQKWSVTTTAPTPPAPTTPVSGTGLLVSAGGGGCVTASVPSAMMSAATLTPCVAGTAAQTWTLPAVGIAGLVKVPVAGTVCLDAWYATGLAGSQIGTYSCVAGAVDETWTFTAAGELRGQNNLCLTAGSGATPMLTTEVCTGATTQKWSVTPAS